jgi:hypothetical protein
MKSPQRAISAVRASAAHVQCNRDRRRTLWATVVPQNSPQSDQLRCTGQRYGGSYGTSRLLTARALAAMSQRDGQWMCGRKCETHLHPFTACSMHHTPCNMQHTPCNVQHTPCNVQHTPCNVQHTPCNAHHATWTSRLTCEADLLPVNHGLRDTHMPPADVGPGLSTDQTSLGTVLCVNCTLFVCLCARVRGTLICTPCVRR